VTSHIASFGSLEEGASERERRIGRVWREGIPPDEILATLWHVGHFKGDSRE